MNPKVHLRAIEPEDLDLLYRIENDVKLWNVGTTNVPYSRYTLHDYVANASDDIYTDRQVRLMVEDASGAVVGIADIVNFDPGNCRAEVGLIMRLVCSICTSCLPSWMLPMRLRCICSGQWVIESLLV